VDVGGFAEPRKILCQCALAFNGQLSEHHRSAHGGAGTPNIKYTEIIKRRENTEGLNIYHL